MTAPGPQVIWRDTVPSGTFRLIDFGVDAPNRFVLEQQQRPDALGGQGWATVGLPLADVLEAAFAALWHP